MGYYKSYRRAFDPDKYAQWLRKQDWFDDVIATSDEDEDVIIERFVKKKESEYYDTPIPKKKYEIE